MADVNLVESCHFEISHGSSMIFRLGMYVFIYIYMYKCISTLDFKQQHSEEALKLSANRWNLNHLGRFNWKFLNFQQVIIHITSTLL